MADYFVDPSIATDTGAGTVGDPWGSTGNHVQRALDLITRNATTGDTIYVKSTGTMTFASATRCNLTAYGQPGQFAPLCITGYDAAAWDGGMATINMNSATNFFDNARNREGLIFAYLDISGTGSTSGYTVYCQDRWNLMYRCIIDGEGTTGGVGFDNTVSAIMNTTVKNISGVGIEIGTRGYVFNNYVVQGSANAAIVGGSLTRGNIVRITNTSCPTGISITTHNGSHIDNNTIYSSVACTGTGIEFATTSLNGLVQNNYCEGFSGVGGMFLDVQSGSSVALYRNNRWFNCGASPETLTGAVVFDDDNSATSVSGLTNASGSVYTPTTELIDKGSLQNWLTLDNNQTSWDIGAIQSGAQI